MLKDSPIGSPAFYLYNILYLTFFTGLMTFGMLFVFYFTYEAPNPLKDVEKMLGRDAVNYNIVQNNITKNDIQSSPETIKATLESELSSSSEILRFFVTDKTTNEPVMTIVSVSSGGFGGPVRALIGTDGTVVKAMSITDASTETAGLGQRVAEIGFQRQFLQKTREELPLDRTEWTPKGINMISGASFSSLSVVHNIEKAFDLYQVGGGN